MMESNFSLADTVVKRPYRSSVLLNNWQEETTKAPPLHGGIPDLGFREYSVTYRDQFKAPPAGASASFKRRPDRYGMVCQATVNEAAFAYGDGWGARASFDTTLGGAAKLQSRDETTAQYRTVTRDAMEAGAQFGREAAIRTAREAAALAGSEFSRPAGGRSNLMLDRGRHTAGISGEMLCLSGDPKKNTIAQRSWMYGPDPGLKFTLNKPEARAEVEGLSLDVRGIPPSAAAVKPGATHGKFAAFQAPARCSTDVTLAATGGKSSKPGRRVFMDDP